MNEVHHNLPVAAGLMPAMPVTISATVATAIAVTIAITIVVAVIIPVVYRGWGMRWFYRDYMAYCWLRCLGVIRHVGSIRRDWCFGNGWYVGRIRRDWRWR